MMGGTIEVHTEQGKGTEFIIRLEMRLQSAHRQVEKIKELQDTLLTAMGQQKAKREQVLPAVEDTVGFKGKHLLLAEDNELNREIALLIVPANKL